MGGRKKGKRGATERQKKATIIRLGSINRSKASHGGKRVLNKKGALARKKPDGREKEKKEKKARKPRRSPKSVPRRR